MAYNTTTWETDSNTKADANSTNSKFHVYKSLQSQIYTLTAEGSGIFFALGSDANVSSSSGASPSHSRRFIWATGGNLTKAYFIAEDWTPNTTDNDVTFKVYKYRPDGSTNTGDIGILSNWTLINTVSPASLLAVDRGIIVEFSEEDCTFAAGDAMAISITCDEDVTGTSDSINCVFVLKEDWNDIISSNV